MSGNVVSAECKGAMRTFRREEVYQWTNGTLCSYLE
jgi:hypothetical protein